MSQLIFHYQKETPFEVGYVADFCVIERKITVQRVQAIHASHYVMFFRILRGPAVRHDRTCCGCGMVVPTGELKYASFEAEASWSIDALEIRTNPGVAERYRELIEFGREIARGTTIDPELKLALLKEQFALMEGIAAQQWRGETRLDRTSVVWAAASTALFFGGIVITGELGPQSERLDAIGWIFGAGLLLMIANAVVFFRAPGRALRRKVLPLLVAALRPLRPSREELDQLLAQMRVEGFAHATKVKSAELVELIEREQTVH